MRNLESRTVEHFQFMKMISKSARDQYWRVEPWIFHLSDSSVGAPVLTLIGCL